MKLPYAVRRYKGKYVAWTPFDHTAQGDGSSKEEALVNLKRHIQEALIEVDGEIGEMEL